MKNNRKGFTLIELLVVIAIIGLLSTLAVVSLNNARQKSRDARRVADVKQVQTALELYFNDNQIYPAALAMDGTGSLPPYMAVVPSDPGATFVYTYAQAATDTYNISYELEGDTGGIPAGPHEATPGGICDDATC